MPLLRWRIPVMPAFVQGTSLVFLTRMAGWFTLLLVLVLAHALAQVSWDLLPSPPFLPLPPPPVVAQPVVAKDQNINALVQAHLFGKVDMTAPAAPTALPTAIPETPLKLTLRGIIMVAPPRGGAIIAEVGGEDHFYRRGDALPGGAILQDVQQKQVFLLHNGRLEMLRIPNDNGTDISGSAASNPSLSRYRDQVLANPMSFLGLVQTEPAYRNGRLEGFRVSPGQDDVGFLQRLGFQPGDVVTALNGTPLDDPMKMPGLLGALRDAPTLNAQVSRQGRTETVVLHFDR